MNKPQNPEDLLEFPCHYQFKAVGTAGREFYDGVVAVIAAQAVVSADAVRSRPSGKGNYQAVSVMVTLHNFEQVKGIYAALRQLPGLKMLL